MNVIVDYETFAPVAALERRVESLEAENAALRADQTSLCDLLADKSRQVALLEQEIARLKRPGVYHFKQPTLRVGREVAGGKR